jgi:hypothetical protein
VKKICEKGTRVEIERHDVIPQRRDQSVEGRLIDDAVISDHGDTVFCETRHRQLLKFIAIDRFGPDLARFPDTPSPRWDTDTMC